MKMCSLDPGFDCHGQYSQFYRLWVLGFGLIGLGKQGSLLAAFYFTFCGFTFIRWGVSGLQLSLNNSRRVRGMAETGRDQFKHRNHRFRVSLTGCSSHLRQGFGGQWQPYNIFGV